MRKLLYISLIAALVGSFTSCKDQDDIYKEWVVPGGSIYPEKANGLRAILGSGRVQLKWAAPKDPAVKRAVITRDNGEKSREISYADFEGQDSILVEINDLKEQSHSFTITNYDAENHVSMTSEKSASPYGAIWLSTHAERTIKSAEMKGADANVALGFGTNEMVATKFRYLNADGEWVITEPVPSAQASTVFANAKGGVRYQYSSGYCPAEGLDTIWNDWSKSPTPIASRLDPSEWEVTATGWNAATPPSKVFDGLVTTDMTKAWVWNNGGKWPVVLQIDMKKTSYVINRMVVHNFLAGNMGKRRLYNVSYFFGDEPFNLDPGSAYASPSGTPWPIATEPTFAKAKYWRGTTFWNGDASHNENANGTQCRYIAMVMHNSRASTQIACQEIEVYGYDMEAE